MKIELKKISTHQSEYKITRSDQSNEVILLNTKTYLVHDICHYIVERNLNFENGFWGMLSKGYQFKELFGKENELTDELRFIEKVVGPIQSIYLNYFQKADFEMLISHIEIEVNNKTLDNCLEQIKNLIETWENLQISESINLEWEI